MIKIYIDEPDKLSNNVLIKYCAFVSFDYDTRIVDYIKSLTYRIYHSDTKEWETPISNLPKICNKFEDIDIDISGNYHTLENEVTQSLIPKDFKFKTKPFNHQIAGVEFALSKKKFLLCDEQGLGKTKQIIDFVSCLKAENKVNRVLIICGVNSLKYNWLSEIETHSNDKGFVLGTRTRKKTGKDYEGGSKERLEDLNNLPDDCLYIITNIETMRAGAEKVGKAKYRFPIAEKIKELCDNGTINVIAFDEAHRSKQPTSMQSRAVAMLECEYMIAMSGTPLMNNPLDLYFPMHWLGYEQHSFYQFKMHYCTLGGFGGSQVIGFRHLDEIREQLPEIMLRRLKTEVLDLPEKLHQFEYVDMTPKQAIIYKEVQEGIRGEINKIRFSNNPLAMLIRLRQATGYTGVLSDTIKESAKLDRMEELVEELTSSNQKCIIFSNWSSITEAAKERLKKYKPAYITGDTESTNRMNQVNNFQNNKDCKVIIGTIGAMGTGLTLTAASTVIFLDSPWNRALKDQAEDRAHRIGTKGTVNVITIVCKNTIDDRIEQLVKMKGQMSDALVDQKLSLSDIEFLIN